MGLGLKEDQPRLVGLSHSLPSHFPNSPPRTDSSNFANPCEQLAICTVLGHAARVAGNRCKHSRKKTAITLTGLGTTLAT